MDYIFILVAIGGLIALYVWEIRKKLESMIELLKEIRDNTQGVKGITNELGEIQDILKRAHPEPRFG